jgi:hypothetical protein
MARPRKVKIFNHIYRIRRSTVAAARAADAWGWLDTQEFVIYVKPGCCGSMIREVVLHEIIHAVNNAVQVEDTKDQDESIASRLTAGILTVFTDNPELTRWLVKNIL